MCLKNEKSDATSLNESIVTKTCCKRCHHTDLPILVSTLHDQVGTVAVVRSCGTRDARPSCARPSHEPSRSINKLPVHTLCGLALFSFTFSVFPAATPKFMNALLAAVERVSSIDATSLAPTKRRAEYAPAAPGAAKHRKRNLVAHFRIRPYTPSLPMRCLHIREQSNIYECLPTPL